MYCLRCGRVIPDSQSFCEACKKTVSQPLEQSPYLNTQIRLPVRKPRVAKPKPTKKQEHKMEVYPSHKDQRALIGFLSVFSLLMVIIGLIFSLFFLQTKNDQVELSMAFEQLELQHKELTDRCAALNKEYVLIIPHEDKIYHRLDCPEVQTKVFTLIRFRSALMQGYRPCPHCE